MKLTNLQRETIVNEIYNDLVFKQNILINEQALLEGEKWFKKYKNTSEYKEYLELYKLSQIKGVKICLNADNKSLYNINISSWKSDLEIIEKIILYYGNEAIKNNFKPINKKEIENKLIISTITGFDLEAFKKEITEFYES